METLAVNWTNESGIEETVEGETLEELQEQLDAVGYEGVRLKVVQENGEVVGWVGGEEGYRYA